MRLVTPAPFLATRALFAAAVPGQPKLADLVVPYQLALSESTGLVEDGELLGAIGFFPVGDGVEECFLVCQGPEQLRRRFVPLQRAGRLIIGERLHHASVRSIVARVARGSPTGRRLAALAGFTPLPGEDRDAFEHWEMHR